MSQKKISLKPLILTSYLVFFLEHCTLYFIYENYSSIFLNLATFKLNLKIYSCCAVLGLATNQERSKFIFQSGVDTGRF